MSNYLSKTKNKKPKTVGRGGKRGKTAGRGTKGQKARAGHRIRPHIRDTIKKLPKLRGRGKNSNKAFRAQPEVVNLQVINAHFESKEVITPGSLFKKGLVVRQRGRFPAVKILGMGEISKPIIVKNCEVSESAREKILSAKGTIS